MRVRLLESSDISRRWRLLKNRKLSPALSARELKVRRSVGATTTEGPLGGLGETLPIGAAKCPRVLKSQGSAASLAASA